MENNLTIHSRQEDVAKFYQRASMVLNLSDKRLFIETFGLTALEAMTAGLPVIVPTEGGIAEMVSEGVNGYKIDVTDLDKIELIIKGMLNDKAKYVQMADNALHSARLFNADEMIEGVEQALVDNSK